MSIHDIARWIGYIVMAAGGIGITVGLLWLAIEGVWRIHKRRATLGVVFDAITEFRERHPERFKKGYEE